MNKNLILLILLFFGFSLAFSAEADLECKVKDSCGAPGEVTVLRMSDTTNAHAELPNQTNYNYYLCCSGIEDLGNNCGAANKDTVLWLSAPTNAHVEEDPPTAGYSQETCLSVTTGQVECGYFDNSCPADYAGLASISASTNAHIGDYNAYSRKVCCKMELPPPCQEHNVWGWAWSASKVNDAAGGIGWISFSCKNCDVTPRPAGCPAGDIPDYGVDINSDTGAFSGYAWSSNIGWIDFDPAGPYPDLPDYSARVDLTNGQVSGWARALAGMDADDGWDGWIKLRKGPTDSGPDYGVSINTGTGEFLGWAWGSDVVGWVSFNCENCEGAICDSYPACGDPAHPDYKVMTSLEITPPNESPTANICCQSCSFPNCTTYTGQVFTLINDSHDLDGDTDIIKSEWDILNWGSDPDSSCSGICDFTPQFLPARTYTADLYVEDSKGESATSQKTFTIKQSAIADFKCSLVNLPAASPDWKICSDIKPNVNEMVYFLDQSDPGDSSITSYSWTFQNGSPATGSGTNPSTKFQSAGAKDVTLTLGVTVGSSDPKTKTISVQLPLPEWQEVAPF